MLSVAACRIIAVHLAVASDVFIDVSLCCPSCYKQTKNEAALTLVSCPWQHCRSQLKQCRLRVQKLLNLTVNSESQVTSSCKSINIYRFAENEKGVVKG